MLARDDSTHFAVKFEGYFLSGFPEYNYGETNFIYVESVSSVMCLNKANITVEWGPPCAYCNAILSHVGGGDVSM